MVLEYYEGVLIIVEGFDLVKWAEVKVFEAKGKGG